MVQRIEALFLYYYHYLDVKMLVPKEGQAHPEVGGHVVSCSNRIPILSGKYRYSRSTPPVISCLKEGLAGIYLINLATDCAGICLAWHLSVLLESGPRYHRGGGSTAIDNGRVRAGWTRYLEAD